MSVLDLVAFGATRWAIVDTLYFDSATHRFLRADLEIDDARIGRILPPGTSRRAHTLRGDATVCVPGLIDSDAGPDARDWGAASQALALQGITTAGVFCRSLADCAACGGPEGVRRFLYVELAEDAGAPGSLGGAERFEGALRALAPGRCEVFPAVVPGEIWSAATLLAVASIAERLGRRLCVRLSATLGDAKRYRETRFFTEVGLLSYLSLLPQTTIFNLSQLSRRDVAMVNDSSANLVCAPGALSEPLLEPHFARLSLKDRAVGFAIGRRALADADRYASLIALSMTLLHQAPNAAQTCDTVVDSLTRSAASALGVASVGAIATGMKADLCLFERPPELVEQCDSRYFVKLLVERRPRDVLVDGVPVVLDGAFVREPEQA
jgi:cytosine/adenosine deaminase-related metal-dependent hydrolase